MTHNRAAVTPGVERVSHLKKEKSDTARRYGGPKNDKKKQRSLVEEARDRWSSREEEASASGRTGHAYGRTTDTTTTRSCG